MNISILPRDIQSKILIYYFSYGTPCSKLISQEINDKCKDNTVTLWRAKLDYEIRPGKKYMLQKYAIEGGNWDVLWDLRLAMLEYDPKNQNSTIKHFCIDGAKTLKKNTIMKLLEEEEDILLSNYKF
jgi:hypothetical protein